MTAPLYLLPTDDPEAVQKALNDVRRSIDALGGTHTRADRESGYADAYDTALTAAIKAVEALVIYETDGFTLAGVAARRVVDSLAPPMSEAAE